MRGLGRPITRRTVTNASRLSAMLRQNIHYREVQAIKKICRPHILLSVSNLILLEQNIVFPLCRTRCVQGLLWCSLYNKVVIYNYFYKVTVFDPKCRKRLPRELVFLAKLLLNCSEKPYDVSLLQNAGFYGIFLNVFPSKPFNQLRKLITHFHPIQLPRTFIATINLFCLIVNRNGSLYKYN